MSLIGLLAKPDGASERLVALVKAWRALEAAGAQVEVIGDGVDLRTQQEYLAGHGLRLPVDLSMLYRHAGGVILVRDAGIELYGWPLETLTEIGVGGMENHREPEQLRWIGGDTGGELFGIWLPKIGDESTWTPAVVARQGGPYDQVVAASGIVELLTEMTVINLQDERPPGIEDALEALRVPADLRHGDPDAAAYRDEVAAWADPLLGQRGYYVSLETEDMADIPATVEALSRSLGSR